MIPASVPNEREAFAELLAGVRARVDASLATWLRPRVEAASRISPEAAAAAQAIERLARSGGKRMRAALVAAAYEGGGGGDAASEGPLAAMLAVELLQVYLLIHDDWMDDDDVRRGGPAVHVELRSKLRSQRLGDACAVLAGDLASAYAQDALLESKAPAEHVLRAARAFAKIQEDVVSGQIAEMAAAVIDGARAPTVEQIHALKTASYTVTGPLALGALLAGASDASVAALARFGRPLGVAFQLRDDLLGVFGDPSATGKPVGNDIRQGKRTALVVELRGDRSSEALLARALGNAQASDADVAALVRVMETSGARARVEARLRELLEEARRALDATGIEGRARRWLGGAVTALGERST
jgi:geranylgeranyl diphosphate synthase type I